MALLIYDAAEERSGPGGAAYPIARCLRPRPGGGWVGRAKAGAAAPAVSPLLVLVLSGPGRLCAFGALRGAA